MPEALERVATSLVDHVCYRRPYDDAAKAHTKWLLQNLVSGQWPYGLAAVLAASEAIGACLCADAAAVGDLYATEVLLQCDDDNRSLTGILPRCRFWLLKRRSGCTRRLGEPTESAIRAVLSALATQNQIRETGESHLKIAASTRDVSFTLLCVTAGLRPFPHEDIYRELISDDSELMDDSGCLMDDTGVAHMLRTLQRAKISLPVSEIMSQATYWTARKGFSKSLEVLAEMDPLAFAVDQHGHTLLHAAARGAQPLVCKELMKHHADMLNMSDHRGFTPVGLCLCAAPCDARDVANSLFWLTQHMEDVTDLLLQSGLCYDASARGHAPHFRDVLTDNARTKMLLYVCAAIRCLPNAMRAICGSDCSILHGLALQPLLGCSMDICVNQVYIADPYRAGGMNSVPVATATDAVLRKLPARCENPQGAAHDLSLDQSETLRAWAFLRRLQALWCRHGILKSLLTDSV